MADSKISALPQGVPASADLVPYVAMGGPTTQATLVSSLSALVLLEQHTAAGSAELDFTTAISAAYDEYVIEFVNVLPATNAVTLQMQVSTNGGSTYDTGTNYQTAIFRWSKSAAAESGSATDTAIPLTTSQLNTAADGGFNGQLRFYNPLNAAAWKLVTGTVAYMESTTPELIGASVAGAYKSATAVNAFRVLYSSGNIASGTVRVYGVRK